MAELTKVHSIKFNVETTLRSRHHGICKKTVHYLQIATNDACKTETKHVLVSFCVRVEFVGKILLLWQLLL